MVFESDTDSSVDALSPLQVKLNEKEEEAERIRAEIERAKLDAQLLRLQLEAHGIYDESLIPPDLMSGGLPKTSEVPYLEIKRLFSWLAENCDMATKASFMVPDPEVQVGSDTVYLGHMSQWKLRVSGDLRFSVPFECESELLKLLRKARTDTIDDDELERFARNWVLTTTELHTEATPMPALFLINQSSQRACVVSSWPKVPVPQLPQAQTSFDPGSFFCSIKPTESTMASNCVWQTPLPQQAEEVSFVDTDGYACKMVSLEVGLAWERTRGDDAPEQRLVEEIGVSFDMMEQFTVSGPYGPCVINDPFPGPGQRWLVNGMVALALEHGIKVLSNGCRLPTDDMSDILDDHLIAGDAVEVLYGEHWLRGVLQAVHGEIAHIRCDVDTNGAITRAPLDRVRPASLRFEGPEGEAEHVAGSH